MINDSRIEIHVWIELSFDEVVIFQSDPFQLERNIQKGISAGHRKDLISNLFDYARTRIVILVNTVSETHQTKLARLHSLDVVRHFVDRTNLF